MSLPTQDIPFTHLISREEMTEDNPGVGSLPSILALPSTTVRQLGSSQVLTDSTTVVKELIDNALDARANAIFVDITANTVDTIQVKDTGHGIPQEDRSLVCRRYCTSKLREFDDLKEIGGKWLGFRGESMASLAEMSGTLEIMTRVEGESVALKLKYEKSGELASSKHTSAPVGTTVKVTNFFEALPVRRQSALRNSAKSLTKIRRLIQAYALARPTVRFGLRILQAKSNKGDFIYAPKKDANVEDAVLKIVSKDCALQCDWTAIESDAFQIHAILPKPSAVGSKVANEGAFISIDGRPVSSSRGTPKHIVIAVRERLRKVNPSLGQVRDPFLYMNIICPPASYDPNIEPAKDNVLFENGELVICIVKKLLASYYLDTTVDSGTPDEGPVSTTSAPQHPVPDSAGLSEQPENTAVDNEDLSLPGDNRAAINLMGKQSQWLPNMYGIDEEDIEYMSEKQMTVTDEEEEGRQSAAVSNPWTIARMNAAFGGRTSPSKNHLMTPAKQPGDILVSYSSPTPAMAPLHQESQEPLTPQTTSKPLIPQNVRQGTQRHELSILSIKPDHSSNKQSDVPADSPRRQIPSSGSKMGVEAIPTSSTEQHSSFGGWKDHPILDMIPASSKAPLHGQRRQQSKKYNTTNTKSHDHEGCTNTPMNQPRNRKSSKSRKAGVPPSDPAVSSASKRIANAEDSLLERRLYSEKNTDIRDFFGQSRREVHHRRHVSPNPSSKPSFDTAISNKHGELLDRASHRAHDVQQLGGSSSFTAINASLRELPEECSPVSERGKPRFPYPSQPSPLLQSSRDLFEANVMNTKFNAVPGPSRRATAKHHQDIISYFRTQEEQAGLSQRQPPFSTNLTNRSVRKKPEHETVSKARVAHRRTIDRQSRPMSSKLPLERVADGDYIHKIILVVGISPKDVSHSMRKLDMMQNSPEWGYPIGNDTYDIFNVVIADGKLTAWTVRSLKLLDDMYGKRGKVDLFSTLRNGIIKTLRGRRPEMYSTEESTGTGYLNRITSICTDTMERQRIQEWSENVTTAGALDLDPPATSNGNTVSEACEVGVDTSRNSIGDEEMLMDC